MYLGKRQGQKHLSVIPAAHSTLENALATHLVGLEVSPAQKKVTLRMMGPTTVGKVVLPEIPLKTK